MLDEITPLLLTLDEEENIGRTLDALSWAKDIVVVDSGSRDRTKEILGLNSAVRIYDRAFDCHGDQWNFGLKDCGIETEWVLALDADHVLSDELVSEIAAISVSTEIDAYEACFVYCVFGRPLRGSLYPARAVLFRKSKAEFFQDGHTQRLRTDSPVGRLEGPIYHDDRKPLTRWLASQGRYGILEARKLENLKWEDLTSADRMRRSVVFSPPAALLYCLLFKGCLLDGWPGWYYALQRLTAESIISLAILDARLRRLMPGQGSGD